MFGEMSRRGSGPKKSRTASGGGSDLASIKPLDYEGLYLSARSWGVQPSEFWDMTFHEWIVEFEMRMPEIDGGYAGSLTMGAVADLKEWLETDGVTFH